MADIDLSSLANGEEADKAKTSDDIIDEIIQQNPELFKDIDEQKRKDIAKAFSVRIMRIQQSHSGPLPEPLTLAHYNNIIPNGAERIMAMAEKEQEYRHSLTKTIALKRFLQISRGQSFGFILGFIGLLGGIFLAYSGKETSGLSTIIISIGSLVTAFLLGNKQDPKDETK